MSMVGEMPFGVSVTQRDAQTVVAVVGEVDISVAAEFFAAVETAELAAHPVVIDLTATTFMDSSGIAVLIRVCRQVEAVGGKLSVVTSPGPVRKVLAISGLTARLQVDVADADHSAPLPSEREGVRSAAATEQDRP